MAEPVRGDLAEPVKSPSATDMCHQRASEWFTDPLIFRPVGLYSTREEPRLEARRVERKLSAIFAADVEGYSRLMHGDEKATVATLSARRAAVDELIARTEVGSRTPAIAYWPNS